MRIWVLCLPSLRRIVRQDTDNADFPHACRMGPDLPHGNTVERGKLPNKKDVGLLVWPNGGLCQHDTGLDQFRRDILHADAIFPKRMSSQITVQQSFRIPRRLLRETQLHFGKWQPDIVLFKGVPDQQPKLAGDL